MTIFQFAALAWFANALARLLLYATNAFGYGNASSPSFAVAAIGALLCLTVSLLLWFKPGFWSAFTGFVFGFYAVPGLATVRMPGTPGWLILLAALGLLAFGLSTLALWRTRRRPQR